MENYQSKTLREREASPDKIVSRLREMFGEDRVIIAASGDFRVDDELERVVAFPHSIEELSEMMRLASEERWRVIPAGAGTWVEMGHRPTSVRRNGSTVELNPPA